MCVCVCVCVCVFQMLLTNKSQTCLQNFQKAPVSLAMSVRPSVRPHDSTRLPLHRGRQIADFY